MTKNIRIVSIFALAALAAASQAVVFNFTGATTGLTAGQTTFTSTQITAPGFASQSQTPFNAVTSGIVTLTGGAGSTFKFTSGADALTVTFSALTDGNGGTATSFASTGTITGSGSFLAYTGQTVAVASNTLTAANFNTFSINGQVNPVPEPSAFAALGLGAVALVRRRRKA